MAVTQAIWDCDLYLLGTPGGTVDLRTGELTVPIIEDYISKLTSVTPADTADCPLWLKFLNEVTKNNRDLIRFYQQWCGYCLTGDVKEHQLLFAHGPGGNGKGSSLISCAAFWATTPSTPPWTLWFWEALISIHRSCDVARRASRQGDRTRAAGAAMRLPPASETEEGRAWAEARIKALTGADLITARFMRQDFFTFQVQFN
jgi:putative DNA primase/helicase